MTDAQAVTARPSETETTDAQAVIVLPTATGMTDAQVVTDLPSATGMTDAPHSPRKKVGEMVAVMNVVNVNLVRSLMGLTLSGRPRPEEKTKTIRSSLNDFVTYSANMFRTPVLGVLC
jgi:formylmethanofuran dehydrogenase subunit B